jgi:transcriptional regulator with XRE-family HTH domain
MPEKDGFGSKMSTLRSTPDSSYLNDIEHDRTVPTLKALGLIADALGLSVRDFLKDVHPYDHD